VRDVSYAYPESSNGVRDLAFTVRKGERILLLGKNGSGKSTLLSLVGGRRCAATGSVTVLGKDAFNDTSLNWLVSLIGVPWPPEAYFNCSVRRVASPAPDEARRAHVAKQLSLPLGRDIDKMSAGEKRRVQVLHGMLRPPHVLLLDECSTEVDVAERRNVLQLATDECEGPNQACCIYATHILDGVEEWATRVIVMERGRIIRDEPYGAHLAQDKLQAHRWLAKQAFTPFPAQDEYPFPTGVDLTPDQVAVECKQLSFRGILENCSLRIPRGSRTLLVGCNGSGKTTLLHLLAGKTFFKNSNSELTIHGHRCYHDIVPLNQLVSFGGDWWKKVPDGEMRVGELVSCPLTEHAEHVRATLAVDLAWDVRYVSAGEQKRIQLLLALESPKDVILLDEATADLDLDMRHVLLHLLARYSVEHRTTVIYTTHIFEGLENWATDCIILDRTLQGVSEHLRGHRAITFDAIVQKLYRLKDAEDWYTEE
jgi:CCR4-NOT complex subunit CAF16